MPSKTSFLCQACGHQSPRWLGKCPDCGRWNSLKEERVVKAGSRRPVTGPAARALPIGDIELLGQQRLQTGIGEFDRVLGGGVVPGSVVLIGGDPGIGKTTLLLQAVPRLAQQHDKVLYVSGEESAQQIRMRGERLGAESSRLYILAE